MGSISDSAIIVLCIVAAGVVVLVGWAVTHRIRAGDNGDDERVFYAAESGTGGQSQFQHMRETRERYKEEIMARFGHRQHNRPRQQSFPMSGAGISGAPTSGPSDYSYY